MQGYCESVLRMSNRKNANFTMMKQQNVKQSLYRKARLLVDMIVLLMCKVLDTWNSVYQVNLRNTSVKDYSQVNQ